MPGSRAFLTNKYSILLTTCVDGDLYRVFVVCLSLAVQLYCATALGGYVSSGALCVFELCRGIRIMPHSIIMGQQRVGRVLEICPGDE